MPSRLNIEEGWFTLLLVWGMIIVAAAAILDADLIKGLEVLPVVSTAAVFSGLALAKSRFSGRTAHIMGLIYGLFLVTFLIGRTLPGNMIWRERIFDLYNRQLIWLGKAISQGSSRDALIFVIHTSGVFWLLGYTASWYTFRKPRLLPAILPSGLVLLSVIYYYYGPKPLVGYLALYTLIVLIYVARTHLIAQERLWRIASVRYEKNIRFTFFQASLLASLVALGLAWSLPSVEASTKVSDALGGTGVSGVWREFQDNWTRLFSSLRSYGTATSDPYRGTIFLGGPRSFNETLIMDVYVDEQLPYVYWSAAVYDTYQNGGWSIDDSSQRLHLPDEGPFADAGYVRRAELVQKFINFVPNSGTIYGAPDVVHADRQVFVTQSEDGDGNPVVHSVQSRFVMRQGEEYEVTSSYSTADATNLRLASTEYPEWITDKYLQVPDSITPETLELAADLVDGLANPFDKAISVRNYLRANIGYNDQIDAPPDGVEPIHYILFDRQEAYCNYYASSMIMMLRSQGVPSRFVAGYSQGQWDDESGSYRVRGSNSHAWVEVFFPQYGWIQFEPTAGRPVGERPESAGNPGDAFGDESLTNEEDRLPEDSDADDVPEGEGLGDLLNDSENLEETGVASDRRQSIWRIAAAVIILGLAIAVVIFAGRTNMQVESSVNKSYGRLANWAPWLGVHIKPAHTPYERVTLLAAAVPEGREPLRHLVHQFVRQQFSRARSVDAGFDPRGEWQVLRPRMLRQMLVHQLTRLRNFRKEEE